MTTASASTREHPVLPAEVIAADGSRRSEERVFCDVRLRSVPLDVCRECPSCIEIESDERSGQGCVRCSPPQEIVPATVPSAGNALRRGVVAVDETVLVRDVVALFVERRLRMVVVTDSAGRAGGVVHESQLLRQIQDHARAQPRETRLGWQSTALERAAAIMSPAATILEDVPLREAVMAMATAHQRQLLVVDEQGFPVGVLIDVDALHALHASAQAEASDEHTR